MLAEICIKLVHATFIVYLRRSLLWFSIRRSLNSCRETKSKSHVLLGNYVLIDHGQSEFSLYAHLKPGSVRVKPGDQVKAGDVIGNLGSSGNSTEPHLHFQITDKPDLAGAGIPMNFSNITILWADLPRPIQSGDIVIAK